MSDNKVTLDQLDNSAVEAMTMSVGDVNMLNTENKTIVGALAEIVGKKEIANAIGEPLAETDKFTEMSSEINGLLSTFKTNMMNAGVVVESSDKFKQLIDKIKGLTEGEGNKGIQFAEGVYTHGSTDGEVIVPINLSFTPTLILVLTSVQGYSMIYSNQPITNLSYTQWQLAGDNTIARQYKVIEISKEQFKLSSGVYRGNITWYAIGVGEEDTTLRDSLASILGDKGVDVTEEDDMASLIGKVDEEFDEMNNEIDNLNNQVNQVNNSYDSLKNVLTTKGIIVSDNVSFDDLIAMVNNTLYWERLVPGQTNTYFTSVEGNYFYATKGVTLLVTTVEMSSVNFPSYPITGITCKVSNLGFGATDYMGAYITVELEGSDGTVKSTANKYYKMTRAVTDYFDINTTVLKSDKIKVYFMLSSNAYSESVHTRPGTVSIMANIKKS